jgi:hypothetical protein
MLERFEKANLQLHPGKCAIAQLQVKNLGYTLSDKGVSASSDKIKAVKDYPVPRNAKDVRAFLGLSSLPQIGTKVCRNGQAAYPAN